MTPLEAVQGAERELAERGVPSPRVDAEHLVSHVLGISRGELYANGERLGADHRDRLRELLERRGRREPLAYILGEWGFRRLTLSVDPRVLIPRPETEVVVERCLALLELVPEPRVLDVGTGSGAIALAIAEEHPGASVCAVDSSAAALAVAHANRARHGLEDRVRLVQADLLAASEGPYDLVVSNPPYVRPEDLDSLQPEIRLYEPRVALAGAGLAERIARDARTVLRPRGSLVLECGDGQAPDLARKLTCLGYEDVAVTRDLTDRERVVEGHR